MFPGAGARIFRNEAGEPIGWDYPDQYEPEYDPDDYLADDYWEEIPGESEERCPACGEWGSFCRGHGEIGDQAGHQILRQHDEGDHSSCNPLGCEEANNAR